jgi:hypothetical protein
VNCVPPSIDLAWAFARRAAGLGTDDAPVRIYDSNLSDDRGTAARLARLAVYKVLEAQLGSSIRLDVRHALLGASGVSSRRCA